MIRRAGGIVLLWALLTGFTFPGHGALGQEELEFLSRELNVSLVAVEGYRPVPEEWVRHALANHQFPYDLEALLGENFPIYLTDRQIHTESGGAVAVTIAGEVILVSGSATPNRTIMEETVLHEVAHALASRTMGKRWSEYRQVRGLTPDYRINAPLWHKRLSEIFAEDFAHLFGTEAAKEAAWKFPDLPVPTEVSGLREFFMDLVGPGTPLAEGRVSLEALRTELAGLPGLSPRLADLPWSGDLPVTRAQAAYMLHLALNGESAQGLVSRSDLAQWPAWAALAIEQVQAHGLLTAKPDGRFAPDEFLDKVDAAQALKRLRVQEYAHRNDGGGANILAQ